MCGAWKEQKCVQSSGKENLKENTIWKTWSYMGW
jgi:hypothetical protein